MIAYAKYILLNMKTRIHINMTYKYNKLSIINNYTRYIHTKMYNINITVIINICIYIYIYIEFLYHFRDNMS